MNPPQFIRIENSSMGIYEYVEPNRSMGYGGREAGYRYSSLKWGKNNNWLATEEQAFEWAVYKVVCPGCEQETFLPKEDYICEGCRG